MTSRILLLLAAIMCAVNVSNAQFCGTNLMLNKLLKQHPELASSIAQYNDQLEKEITARISKMDLSKLARTTSGSDTTYIIPIVVHVIHDYGAEDISEAQITGMLANLNNFYQLKNDTSGVVPFFKKYVGKMNFIFRLATKDPQGNPTRGITRTYSYLTYGGDEQAKLNDWNPRSYMNIWTESSIGQSAEGGIVLAYAEFPSTAAVIPYWDGLMVNATYIGITGNDLGATVPHEVGHYFNLYHTFGNTNTPGLACGDDFVDDTPPTKGELGGCPDYTDTACASNYYKVYPDTTGKNDTIFYPNVANVQNIMNYADCKNMFTQGQVARARAAANSDVGGRDSLWTPFNLMRTGADTSVLPNVPPVADFTVQNKNAVLGTRTSQVDYFLCAGSTFRFRDFSWNDTITGYNWTFTDSKKATLTSTSSQVDQSFTNPGWVNVTLSVTGTHGADTLTKDSLIYVADPTAIPAVGYYEEFTPTGDLNKWPTFNYYNNQFRWEYVTGYGYYDKNCIRYKSFDKRAYPDNLIGGPKVQGVGASDFDDLFSPAFDLTSGSIKSLNFMYAATTRTGNPSYMTDSLEISYSTDCGTTWKDITYLSGKSLVNDGMLGIEFAPLSQTEWSLKSIAVPSDAISSSTFFRFRYRPGYPDANGVGTGNNFYMDRFNLSQWTAGINTLVTQDKNIVVAPNPTNGSAYVVIKDAANTTATIEVTDITGKLIYTATAPVNGMAKVEIPEAAISAKGMYLVKISTGDQVDNEKLVVY